MLQPIESLISERLDLECIVKEQVRKMPLKLITLLHVQETYDIYSYNCYLLDHSGTDILRTDWAPINRLISRKGLRTIWRGEQGQIEVIVYKKIRRNS